MASPPDTPPMHMHSLLSDSDSDSEEDAAHDQGGADARSQQQQKLDEVKGPDPQPAASGSPSGDQSANAQNDHAARPVPEAEAEAAAAQLAAADPQQQDAAARLALEAEAAVQEALWDKLKNYASGTSEWFSDKVGSAGKKMENYLSGYFVWIMDHPLLTCALLVPAALVAVVGGLFSIGAAAICFVVAWGFAVCVVGAMVPFGIASFVMFAIIATIFTCTTGVSSIVGFFYAGYMGLWGETLQCTKQFVTQDGLAMLKQGWTGFLMFVGFRKITEASHVEGEDDGLGNAPKAAQGDAQNGAVQNGAVRNGAVQNGAVQNGAVQSRVAAGGPSAFAAGGETT